MRQWILILVVVAVFFILLRKKSAPRARGDDLPERMVECARCGVNLPISESLRARDRYYCCEEHRASDA